MKTTHLKTHLALAVVAALGIAACNDSGKSTTAVNVASPITKTTSGVITGFGSVFINGVEYETTGSSFVVDGVEGDESLLKLGMVVTLSGTDAANGTGEALKVEFEDEVEGIVLANNILTNGTLNIMGLTVHVNDDTVFESIDPAMATLDLIAKGNVVEVSGYSAGDGAVWATRIEVKKSAYIQGEKIELKGIVSALSPTSFLIGDMLVNYTSAELDDDLLAGLADGMLVKVESIAGIDVVAGALIASKIELKSESGKKSHKFDVNDDEIEVEGVITAVLNATQLEVNGSPITVDVNTVYVHGDASTAMVGLKVKVKGNIDADGNLVAEKLVYKPTGDLKLEGAITAIDPVLNTFTMFGKTIKIDNFTLVKDEKDEGGVTPVKYQFGVDDLVVGDWLKVKAYFNAEASLTAMKMEREDAKTYSVAKLEGRIESIDPTTRRLLIAGITVDYSSKPDLTYVIGEKLEIKGSFVDGVFIATKLESEDSDEYYIGGKDANEEESNEEESKDDDEDDEQEQSDDDDDEDKNDTDRDNGSRR